jgi:uncharacterized repeat protein (TIGR03803 family)
MFAIAFSLLPARYLLAQTFRTLYEFTELSKGGFNNDGANSAAGLIQSGDTLYDTAQVGGSSGQGTVFAVHTDGTSFTTLCNFPYLPGGLPVGSLVLSGNRLYGTAFGDLFTDDGAFGQVFALNTDGTRFTTLFSFLGSSDSYPVGGVTLAGGDLYGTTVGILRPHAFGSVFKLNTDMASFATLHTFTSLPPPFTNSDGANPMGGLTLSSNTLFGRTVSGGGFGVGTVFKLNSDGTGFTNLHSFTDYGGGAGPVPQAGLILSGTTLYGATEFGGTWNNGTVFRLNTDGTGFTNLYSFSGGSDGANPAATLVLSGNTLYGTASAGGSSGNGTVFY